jgi:hypothetical protein
MFFVACSKKEESKQSKPITSAIEICKKNDSRTRVPVWNPSVDKDGNVSSEPPMNDGQIVFIELYQDNSAIGCSNAPQDKLYSFSSPNNPKDASEGGLVTNIRGNVQFANGTCYFSGFFMNEQVMGMHQGWIETFFGAVEKKDMAMSGRFCLDQK